jgi:hypothetical protein
VAHRATEGSHREGEPKGSTSNSSLQSELGKQAIESESDSRAVASVAPTNSTDEPIAREVRKSAPGDIALDTEENQPTGDEYDAAIRVLAELEEQPFDGRSELIAASDESQEGSSAVAWWTTKPLTVARTEPDWNAYRAATEAAYEQPKREAWLGVGRLDDHARWAQRLAELAREFGVDT